MTQIILAAMFLLFVYVNLDSPKRYFLWGAIVYIVATNLIQFTKKRNN